MSTMLTSHSSHKNGDEVFDDERLYLNTVRSNQIPLPLSDFSIVHV